jgi:hypothetical protein
MSECEIILIFSAIVIRRCAAGSSLPEPGRIGRERPALLLDRGKDEYTNDKFKFQQYTSMKRS